MFGGIEFIMIMVARRWFEKLFWTNSSCCDSCPTLELVVHWTFPCATALTIGHFLIWCKRVSFKEYFWIKKNLDKERVFGWIILNQYKRILNCIPCSVPRFDRIYWTPSYSVCLGLNIAYTESKKEWKYC